MTEIKEIDKIIFGILSPTDMVSMSVALINNTKLSGTNSVYDQRMGGNIESHLPCVTCGQTSKICPGHFGHIELNEYIVHPLYYKSVVNFLKVFCNGCGRLLLSSEQIELLDISKYTKERKFFKILEKVEKIDSCHECGANKNTISYSPINNSIFLSNKDNKIELSIESIHKIFDSITDEDVVLCGFDPTRIHPRNLIMTIFPVIPPCSRPPAFADGSVCDDDLTIQLLDIVKNNNILKDVDKADNRYQKALQSLKFRITTFFNNSKGKAKHPTNNRPIKGIKERLTGKKGQLRENLMGKRVEFSGRTVIGPEPNLRLGEVGIPIEVSQELTIPEYVTPYNIKILSDIVNSNRANFVVKPSGIKINLKYGLLKKGTELFYGDVVVRGMSKLKVINGNVELKEGDIIMRKEQKIDVVYPVKKKITIEIGDVVHRHLKDNDILLLNRQPTLHRGSMLAKRVKVMKGKTFRFNLASTKTFNADFDGDEMNIHIPQSLEARAELEFLSATKYNIMSAQGSANIIQIVQDALAASYMMTRHNEELTKAEFFNISLCGDKKGELLWSQKREDTIKAVLKENGKPEIAYNGKGLFSLILPEDFIYEKKNDCHPEEPVVKIYKGVLYEGALNKALLGGAQNSLIQTILKEYGEDTASEFIDNVHFICNNWLLVNGFSIGLEDCLINDPKCKTKIQDSILKCFIEAEEVSKNTYNAGIKEVRITASLNKAKDIGMKIAKDDMSSKNNLLSTVMSGSKGDFFNISQITGLLGQQNLLGQRIKPVLNKYKRTLLHYPTTNLSPELEYESMGFIRHSFVEGLTPQEFYFHAQSGREGICDTATGTAKSGYTQRRMIKTCEDIQVKYDGTVRDINNNIYQLAYGENGMNPCFTVKVKDTQQPCDVSRLVNQLNLHHENNTIEEQKVEKSIPVKIEEVKPQTKSILNRVHLLKELSIITGKKAMYSGKTDLELFEMINSLKKTI